MDFSIAGILALDGLTNGAVYALLALATVLVFAVTRVIFIPQGEFVAFGALTLALLQTGKVPGTVWFLLVLAVAAALYDLADGVRHHHKPARIGMTMLRTLAIPVVVSLVAIWAAPKGFPLWVQALLTLALVTPFGKLIYRLAYQSLADASVLVLLIVSLALHFLLSGLGLLFFGPEGSRTQPLASGSLPLGDGFTVSGQVILMVASAVVLSGLFFLVFERTIAGKALRATAVNRVGARLVGIRPARTALLAYGCASLLAGLIGVLIAPVTTMYYDSGFIIGLKAFVAAIIGGLVSYPMTAIGALAVGVVESFASFWSGALKDVIVFSLLIPVLMLRSFMSVHAEEEEEEVDQ